MPRIKKISVLLFLLVSGYFIVPAELVHELAFHEDTSDVSCDPGKGLSLGAEHHHCEILQLYIPPCKVDDGTVDFTAVVTLVARAKHDAPEAVFESPGSFVIRGPPAVAFSC